ncbi:alpha/beta hydrolase family protein [Sphingomicrobium flavum]|uniref:alpha/beta hydrolase family protein n=1 Tax=Sphingomicrobium flavum TaxID=1229164 RepID=UPI0021AE0FED|nr:S9 family peptidase [Sphingomicrobium flavum]
MLRLILACLLLAAEPARAQTAEPLSAEDFAAPRVWSTPRLSPDGNKIAFIMHEGEDKRIVIIDANDPQKVIRQANLGKQDLQSLRWAGNERLLVKVLGEIQLFRRFYYADRLYVYDVARDQSYEAAPEFNGTFAGNILYIDASGDWALVSGQKNQNDYPSIRRVDLATGKSAQVENQMRYVWTWFADGDGVVRAAIQGSKKNDFVLHYRDTADEKFRQTKIKLERDDDDEALVEEIFISLTDEPSVAISNFRTGRFALYEFDIAQGRLGNAVFEHPTHDIDAVMRHPKTGDVIGVSFHDEKPRIHWLDPDIAALQTKLDRALAGNANEVLSFSDDGNRLIIRSGRGSDPGLYYLFDRAAGRLDIIANPYERIDPDQLSPVQPVKYTARDGLEIEGFLTLPKGREAKNLPLILMPHGGPFARDEWGYDPEVQFLAQRGYAVFQPNFRGSTGRGRDFVEKGYGQFGSGMLNDMFDGVDWLASQGTIDPQRVCIVGSSYGGYAAMWAAITAPERLRCAASFAGVSNLNALRRHDRKMFSPTRYTTNWRDQIAGDVAALKELDEISPIEHAGRLRIPIFIAHGKDDKRVPVSQSEEMIEKLVRAGRNPDWVVYPENGHGFEKPEDHADYLKRLSTFLAEHNPAN